MNDYQAFIEYLFSKGFILIEDNKERRFVTYGYNGVYVRLPQDGDGTYSIEVARVNSYDYRDWYDIDIICFLVRGTRYSIDGLQNFREETHFFIENYERIMHLFSQFSFQDSVAKMNALHHERALILFGDTGK